MAVEKEGFASRWSRRKQEVVNETAVEDSPEIVDGEEIIVDEPVDEGTLAEQRLEKLNALTDEDMPDIETLNEDSDFSGFMSTGVSETLRKMALQKLFQGKSYNIRDGLDEYDGDYTSFEKLDPSIITCDMKHIIEVEAEKARLAKEEQKKEGQEKEELLKAEEGEQIAEREDTFDEVDKDDKEDKESKDNDEIETMVAEAVDLDVNDIEYDEMELDDIESEGKESKGEDV